MSHTPRVSIGLPVYNGEEYLAETLECLLGQSYTDCELVISDNASCDRTSEICRDYALSDSRIQYFRQRANRGSSWNFNEVFRLSRGEYFKWAADDDLIDPRFVEKCVGVLDSDPTAVLSFCRAAVIDENGDFVVGSTTTRRPKDGLLVMTDEPFVDRWEQLDSPKAAHRYRGVLLSSIRCYEMFGLIRSSALRKTRLERPYVGGDKVLLAELGLLGRFACFDELMFYSRWHPNRFSANPSFQHQASFTDPNRSRQLAIPHQLRTSRGYLQLIMRRGLGIAGRLSCLAVWLRFLFQASKWKGIVHNMIHHKTLSMNLPDDYEHVPRQDAKTDRNAPTTT